MAGASRPKSPAIWQDFRLSVAEVEAATKLSFFSSVGPGDGGARKARVDGR